MAVQDQKQFGDQSCNAEGCDNVADGSSMVIVVGNTRYNVLACEDHAED